MTFLALFIASFAGTQKVFETSARSPARGKNQRRSPVASPSLFGRRVVKGYHAGAEEAKVRGRRETSLDNVLASLKIRR
jgi:hypothetical protein